MRILKDNSEDLEELLEREKKRFRQKETVRNHCSRLLRRLKYFISIIPGV
jgi:hypothetical protein